MVIGGGPESNWKICPVYEGKVYIDFQIQPLFINMVGIAARDKRIEHQEHQENMALFALGWNTALSLTSPSAQNPPGGDGKLVKEIKMCSGFCFTLRGTNLEY